MINYILDQLREAKYISIGSRDPAVYGIYGARKGPVSMESDVIWTALGVGNVSTGIGLRYRA